MVVGEGVRVALVDANGKVRLQAIQVGRNLGENVEVLDGVSTSDRVILNPADSLSEGDQVSVAAANAKDVL